MGNILMDCLANGPSIRAQNLCGNFEDKMAAAVNDFQRVSLSSAVAGQWLTIRLQCLGIIVTFSLAVVAVFNAVYDIAPVSASMLGLSLSYAFALVGYLNGLVSSIIESEQEMISVERMDEYIHLRSEYSSFDDQVDTDESDHDVAVQGARMDDTWPFGGGIVLEAVSFSYEKEKGNVPSEIQESIGAIHRATNMVQSAAKHLNTSFSMYSRLAKVGSEEIDLSAEDVESATERVHYALKNVSVEIPTGSRVAVVGRTGEESVLPLHLLF